jgi:hypothetical protein
LASQPCHDENYRIGEGTMREETLIDAVNDIDTIARLTEDLYDKYYNNEPDYWEKLKHQYAGMAMQGMLSNSDYIERFTAHTIDGISLEEDLTRCAKYYATALVNRLKEGEK